MDHSAITSLAQQYHLATTTSLGKINFRLTKASQYLAQFRRNVRYIPGKMHFVPDSLSRMATDGDDPGDQATDELGYLAADGAFRLQNVEGDLRVGSHSSRVNEERRRI